MATKTHYRIKGILAVCGRIFLGLVFLYASIDKIQQPAAFAEVIANYQILPDTWVNLAAIVLPWLELFLGLLLILGFWLPGATLLGTVLLLIFFSALLFNLARGLDIQCGCFTTSREPGTGAPMVWYIFRDGVFLALAIFLLYRYGAVAKKPHSSGKWEETR
ncbi:MAG: DoxX family membrane protein [Deltaproteobacteria bacterium]|nr:DoxX family membrane protein [Deltaproteobacteria bacterium]